MSWHLCPEFFRVRVVIFIIISPWITPIAQTRAEELCLNGNTYDDSHDIHYFIDKFVSIRPNADGKFAHNDISYRRSCIVLISKYIKNGNKLAISDLDRIADAIDVSDEITNGYIYQIIEQSGSGAKKYLCRLKDLYRATIKYNMNAHSTRPLLRFYSEGIVSMKTAVDQIVFRYGDAECK